jgi:hypothetical protein
MNQQEDPEIRDDDEMDGGRRRKHKGTKKRKENHVLASWRKFVRKVQHEEKITYPEAMKRASKRKSEWQRGGSPDDVEEGDEQQQMGGSAGAMKSSAGDVQDFDGKYGEYGSANGDTKVGGRRSRRRHQRGGNSYIAVSTGPHPNIAGGSRRRRSRGTKKRRGSRRR